MVLERGREMVFLFLKFKGFRDDLEAVNKLRFIITSVTDSNMKIKGKSMRILFLKTEVQV